MYMDQHIDKLRRGVEALLGHYTAIMMDIIPCILVTSLLTAIENLFTVIQFPGGNMTQLWPELSDWLSMADVLASAGTLMIPVYILWSGARRFGGSQTLAIMLGMSLVSAQMISGTEYASAAMDGSLSYWELGFESVPIAGFQGQMIAPFICAVLLSKTERFLNKKIGESFRPVIVPLLTAVCCFFAVMLVIGPVTRAIESAAAGLLIDIFMNASARLYACVLLGLCMLPMMSVGLHLVLIGVQIALLSAKVDSPVWAVTVSAVLAAGGAALADYFIDRDEQARSLSRQGIIITLGLGTVESALFGVCLKKKYAFFAAMTAAGQGGLLIGIFGIGSAQFGVNGFFSLLLLPGEQWLKYTAVLIITIGLSFGLTFALYKMDGGRNNGEYTK